MPGNRAGPAWQQDFRLLWTAETVSSFGSQITGVALPLTAVARLHATPFEMGVLTAASTLPNLFSFYFGALVDRVRRRRTLLVLTDLIRMVLLGLIPIAAITGFLSVGLLMSIAFAAGTASLCFGITWGAYLPSVVPADGLVAANSKLQASMTMAGLAGVSLAGVLVQIFGAPNAMAIDAASFGASAWFLALMRHRASGKEPAGHDEQGMWHQIVAGLRYSLAEPRIRAIAAASANLNLFSSIALGLAIFYLKNVLGMPPSLIGFLFGIWGAGGVVGALLAPALGRRFGEGRAIIGASVVFSLGMLAYPPVRGPIWFEATTLAMANLLFGFAVFVFDVHVAALRQRITPDHMQGRSAATMALVTQGVKPIGALAGGVLGQTAGVRDALWIAAAGALSTVLWTYASPLRAKENQPQPAEPVADTAT